MLRRAFDTNWRCRHTWKRAGVNTSWCLLGCSIGEFGTLALFDVFELSDAAYLAAASPSMTAALWSAPVVNGLVTSVALETGLLMRSGRNSTGDTETLTVRQAFDTAMRMSFASMCCMEVSMEATDVCLTGTLGLNLWAIPPMLFISWLAPLPYNYYRLKVLGLSCH